MLWVLAISTLVIIPMQLASQRQAVQGREAIGHLRAKWAARAGVERYVAYLEWLIDTEQEIDHVRFQAEMEELAHGTLESRSGIILAEYHIQHYDPDLDELVDGPRDAHARNNINLIPDESLEKLRDITPEIIASIRDWIDPDDDVRDGGAESGYYNHPLNSYSPRNAPFRTLRELELVDGVTPELLRDEDWNLNNRLDPNEDDGSDSFPDDDSNGRLEAGWSEVLTAASREPGPLLPAYPRIPLSDSSSADIQEKFSITLNQAAALFQFARSEDAALETLITTPLSTIGNNGQPGGGTPLGARDLTNEELGQVLAQASIGTTYAAVPGKLNINTANLESLELLPEVDETMADEIISLRMRKAEGLQSIVELLEVPNMTREALQALAPYIDVRSNIYEITSVGVALPGRTESQIIVTIDRSSLPIKIFEYLQQ